jgi:hypothetical protein
VRLRIGAQAKESYIDCGILCPYQVTSWLLQSSIECNNQNPNFWIGSIRTNDISSWTGHIVPGPSYKLNVAKLCIECNNQNPHFWIGSIRINDISSWTGIRDTG